MPTPQTNTIKLSMKLIATTLTFLALGAAFLYSKDAVSIFISKSLCNGGLGHQCLIVGNKYFNGEAVRVDWEKAKELYSRGCESENGESCFELARLLSNGLALERAEHKPMELYLRSCRIGYSKACTQAGRKDIESTGIGNNSYELLAKACKMGDYSGCLSLGDSYKVDQGQKESKSLADNYSERAKELVEKSCSIDQAIQACEDWENLFQIPKKKQQEVREFVCKHLTESCENHSAASCFRLAERIQMSKCSKPESKTAIELHEKACQLGFPDACHSLGIHFHSDNSEISVGFFVKACEGGKPLSCSWVGSDFIRRDGSPSADFKTVRSFAEKACKARLASSCLAYGKFLSKGQGGPRNTALAKSKVSQACELGLAETCREYGHALMDGEFGETSEVGGKVYFVKACTMGDIASCGILESIRGSK